MASAGARAYMGAWGRCPQRGPGAEPLVKGWSPPEAEDILLPTRANLSNLWNLNFAAICRKGPERCSGDQKKNRNGVPVRSGSKRTLSITKHRHLQGLVWSWVSMVCISLISVSVSLTNTLTVFYCCTKCIICCRHILHVTWLLLLITLNLQSSVTAASMAAHD